MRFWVGRDYDGPGPTVCPQATAIQCHAKRGLPSGAKCVATTTHWVAGPPNKRSCRDGGFVAAHPGAVNARVTPFTKHTIIKARPAPREARPRPPASVFTPHTRSPFFRPPPCAATPTARCHPPPKAPGSAARPTPWVQKAPAVSTARPSASWRWPRRDPDPSGAGAPRTTFRAMRARRARNPRHPARALRRHPRAP